MLRSLSYALVTVFLLSIAFVAAAQNPTQTPNTATSGSSSLSLSRGAPVKLRLLEVIGSGINEMGDAVAFEVTEDILVQGLVVVPKGALAYGQVTDQSKKGQGRQSGSLKVEIYNISLPGGFYIPVKGTIGEAPNATHKKPSGYYYRGGMWTTKQKGWDVLIERGEEVSAFVDETVAIPATKDYSEAALRQAVEAQKEGLAVDAVKHFGVGAKKIEDYLREKGLTPDAQWAAAPYDDYFYRVTVTVSGQSYAWLVNPFQVRKAREIEDMIKGLNEISQEAVNTVC